MPKGARLIALEILNRLDRGRRTLDSIMEDYSGAGVFDSRPERALNQALVYGVLRWRGRLDNIINHFSKTRFNKINPNILNILRLGLFQIIYLDRIPDSAAVNTAVELAKASGAPWVAGFVNALLRKAARQYKTVIFPDPNEQAVAALALQKSFPEWIINRWINRWGTQTTASLSDSLNTIPPLSVRTNTLKTSRERLIAALEMEADQIEPTVFSRDGITFKNPTKPIPQMRTFTNGWFQVQDEAAQLVSLLLDPRPGETVLDACAGLGGKSGHIAQLMNNQGNLIAADINSDRLSRLAADMQRLGISIARTRVFDLENNLPEGEIAGFDRILLDAPCSGFGVMRRNPDIKWQANRKKLTALKATQLRLLDNLARLVRPNGILVYAVCSPEPEENESVIDEFLKKHHEFAISKDCGRLPDKFRSAAAVAGAFRTFPGLSMMDGFYFVRLERIS